MHRLAEMQPVEDQIVNSATGGEKGVRDGMIGAEIGVGNRKIFEHGAECEEDEGGDRCLTDLPMENGDGSGSGSEDDLDSGGDDGYKQKFNGRYDGDKCGNRKSNSECGVTNESEGQRIEEDERKCGGFDGIEKNVNGGDFSSQKKSLKYNSLSPKSRGAHELARSVHKSCKKGHADGGDRGFFFRGARDIEDNQPILGRKYGGHSSSERPLDSGEYRSVQISDSEEDHQREVSDYDSDGMTEVTENSNGTSRRKTSSTPNKVSSVLEPESSESGWVKHGRNPSWRPRPNVAPREKYIRNHHKYSKHHSSRLAHGLQEESTHEYHCSKDSKSFGVKRGTRDGRYCERKRDVTIKHSYQPKKSYGVPSWKTHAKEDYSYSIDAKHLYNRRFAHGNQRTTARLDPKWNDVPCCSQSERFFTPSGGIFPDYHSGPSCLKNQYSNIHSSRSYREGWSDQNMSERQNFLERNVKMDYDFPDDWYNNQRRHSIQDSVNRSRKRGSQFIYEGDDTYLRRRTKDGYLSPLQESGHKFVGVKYRKISLGSDSYKDHVDHGYDRDSVRDGREMESSIRRERIHDSSFNSSNNLWHTETEFIDWRNIKHRPLRSYSSEEPCAPGRRQFPGASGPKSWVSERNTRCSWKELHMENGHPGTNIATSDTKESLHHQRSVEHHVNGRYQKSSNTYIRNESIIGGHDDDHFVRRYHRSREEICKTMQQDDTVLHAKEPFYHHSEHRHLSRQYQKSSNRCIRNEFIIDDCGDDHFVRRGHRHPKEFQLREEGYKSKLQDKIIFHSEEPSSHVKRTSRYNMANDRPAFGRVAELEKEANRQRPKTLRIEEYSNQFDGCHKSIRPQIQPGDEDSDDCLAVEGSKCTLQSPRRTSETAGDKYYCRHDLTGLSDNQNPINIKGTNDFHPEKAALTNKGKVDATLGRKNQPSSFSENLQDELLDIEEGQIITEEIEDLAKCVPSSEVVPVNDKGQPESASDGNGVGQRLDDEKIREIMVKMERRRERFKEPISTSRDSVKVSNLLPDSVAESAATKRPARKRKWSEK